MTSNRIRPPAVLGKIASTLDVISGGRLIMGLGAGGTHQPAGMGGIPGPNPAIAEYAAYGLTLVPPGEGVIGCARRSRSCAGCGRRTSSTSTAGTTRSRRTGTSRSRSSARSAAADRRLGQPDDAADRGARRHLEHRGPPHNDFDVLTDRVRRLDAECARIGRDPGTISRSLQQIVSYDDPASTRAIVQRAVGLGFDHIVLSLPRPYPERAVRWLVQEIIEPVEEAAA